MPLRQPDIDKLKKLYKEDSGEDLSEREAWAMGTRLVQLLRLLFREDGAHDGAE
ncbi:MAG: hypothetical protein WAU88_05840 [Candidatus Zixiibacteriota bacterium]